MLDQPAAARCGLLEPGDQQARGVGPGGLGQGGEQAVAAVGVEPPPQLLGRRDGLGRVPLRGVADAGRQVGHLGPVGPLELPGQAGAAAGQVVRGAVGGLPVVEPGGGPLLQHLWGPRAAGRA